MKLVEDRDGVTLRVYVRPRARKNTIVGIHGDALKVTITSPPVDGAANYGLREYLATTLGIPPSRVEILSGGTSRHKIVRIRGVSSDRVMALLLQERTANGNRC